MLEINKIYNEDCLEGMKKIDDKSVDTIITDLPYGQTSRNKWDSVIPFEPLWEQYERTIAWLIKKAVAAFLEAEDKVA